MKKVEIKKMSITELNKSVTEYKEQVSKLKFSHAISPLENTASIRKAKKVVARLLTEARIKNN